MLSCVLAGMFLHKVGREIAIIVGLIMIFLQQFGLYMLTYFENVNAFLFWSFTSQMIGGLGSGVNAVASMAMVVSISKSSEREQNIGLIEMATGVGFLLGPIWGSVMYQWGGFSYPFASTTFLYAVTYPFMAVILLNARKRRLGRELEISGFQGSDAHDYSDREGSVSIRYDEIKMKHLVCIPRFIFGLISQILVTSSI